MESGVSWRSGDFTWYLVQEEGGERGVSTRGLTGDILTDDHDYKLRGLTEPRTEQSPTFRFMRMFYYLVNP